MLKCEKYYLVSRCFSSRSKMCSHKGLILLSNPGISSMACANSSSVRSWTFFLEELLNHHDKDLVFQATRYCFIVGVIVLIGVS